MNKVFLSLFILLAAFFSTAESAFAGSEHNLSGFAWSENIGWISFNSTNDHDPAVAGVQPSAVNYGVNIDSGAGNLTGYAWSPNIGWIQFGGLSGFPTGGGTQSVNARLVSSNMIGWAKALSADGYGWDGWISLGGTGYGVVQSSSGFAGYAWGSDVVGWVGFSLGAVPPGPCDPSVQVCLPPTFPSVSFDVRIGSASINGNTAVEGGSSANLSWVLSNLPAGTTCAVSKTSSGGTAFGNISGITASSSAATGVLTQAAYTYQILCQNSGGYSNTQTVSFTVLAAQPGFSIGGNEDIKIQFINSGSSDSEQKSIFVNALGGFTGTVNFSIGGVSPALPASSTILYSLGGGAYSATSTANAAYNGATTFKIRLNSPIPNACSANNDPVGCQWYEVTVNAVSSGVTSRSKVFRIKQSPFNPSFQEI